MGRLAECGARERRQPLPEQRALENHEFGARGSCKSARCKRVVLSDVCLDLRSVFDIYICILATMAMEEPLEFAWFILPLYSRARPAEA
jgi:hypothetical protein